MNKHISTKQIVGTGLLLALEIIFQIIGNYLHIGPINLNISLVTIVIAAAMFGPFSGAVLGFFNGLITLLSPDTLAIFMPLNPLGTVLVCLLKTGIAGLIAGFVFNLLKKKNKYFALIFISILVPIINTGIFSLTSLIIFRPFLEAGIGEMYPNIGAFLIFGVIGWNFVFEIITTIVVSSILGSIILYHKKLK